MCNSGYWSIILYLNQRKLNSQPNIYIKIYHNHIVQMALIKISFLEEYLITGRHQQYINWKVPDYKTAVYFVPNLRKTPVQRPHSETLTAAVTSGGAERGSRSPWCSSLCAKMLTTVRYFYNRRLVLCCFNCHFRLSWQWINFFDSLRAADDDLKRF